MANQGFYDVNMGQGAPGGGRTSSSRSSSSSSSSSSAPSGNPFLTGNEEESGYEAPETVSDRVGYDSLNWVDVVAGEVARSLKAWGDANGYSAAVMGQMYQAHADRMFFELQTRFHRDSYFMDYYQNDPDGLNTVIDWAINWYGGKLGADLSRKSGGGGGGRGRGRRGPSAADIRNQFDIKELTNAVNEMNMAMVFEEHPNAKRLATEYVDAIVATRGEKKIDFATFVEERISSTARFKAIYRNKPEHLQWSEYIGPYLGAARNIASPDRADELAIGAAQFGASPQAFQERLKREDTVTGSAPFIRGLEDRMNSLSSIFKG